MGVDTDEDLGACVPSSGAQLLPDNNSHFLGRDNINFKKPELKFRPNKDHVFKGDNF